MIDLLNLLRMEYAACIIVIVGALGGIFQTKPIDKLLMLLVLGDGLTVMIVSFGYLDVALIVCFMFFMSTIIMMISFVRMLEARKQRGS